jgi:hypothetical protein
MATVPRADCVFLRTFSVPLEDFRRAPKPGEL